MHLTGRVNDKGQFELEHPKEGIDPALWSAVGICLEKVSKGDTGAAKQYLKAVNGSINLLMQLGLNPQKVARVLTESPDIVSVVRLNGPKRFTLTGLPGGKPQIASITTTVIVYLATTLAQADEPAACCKLLAACGTNEKHLKGLVLSGYAAALEYWPDSKKDSLSKKLAQVGQDLQRTPPAAWGQLVSSPALTPPIRALLWPQMPDDVHAKGAREAALKLLTTWVSALDTTEDAAKILYVHLKEDVHAMSRLLDMARLLADESLVLADEHLNEAFSASRERLAAALPQVAHATLWREWSNDPPREDLPGWWTEIPKTGEKALRPLAQCMRIGIVLGKTEWLAMWIPMLDDIEMHMWSEPIAELAALCNDIQAGLWQVGAHFPDLEVAAIQVTLHRFSTTLRDGLDVSRPPEAILPPRSLGVLDRRCRSAEATKKLDELYEELQTLSVGTHSELEARIRIRLPGLGSLLGDVEEIDQARPVEEMDRARQRQILNSLLRSVACRDFLRWMANEAGYDVVTDMMVSLLGPNLLLAPAELHTMLMAQPDDLRFALCVALCPLVPTLVSDNSAPALAELLLRQWSYRADAPTLLFEACTASTMYTLLMAASAREHVLDGSPHHLERCIDQFLDAHKDGPKSNRRYPLVVLADCALRCRALNASVFEHAIDELSKKEDIPFRDGIENGNAVLVFETLHGRKTDPWLRVKFSILTNSFKADQAVEAAAYLLRTFQEEDHNDRLRAVIFQSKLNPLPRTSLEYMSKDDRGQWETAFASWCTLLRFVLNDETHFLKACRLMLSELINAQASASTVCQVLTLLEKQIVVGGLTGWAAATEDTRAKFNVAVKDARTREIKGKKKAELLPELAHAPLRSNVKSLTEVGNDEDELVSAISDLVDHGLLASDLQLVLLRGARHGLPAGIAQPNLLRALMLKKDPGGAHQRPLPELLTWLGLQCCAWPGAGTFVRFLSTTFSSWTQEDQWSNVDVEQVAAFMSGVLQSTLAYLDEKQKNILKIDVPVATLLRLSKELVFERFGENLSSPHVEHCMALLELLSQRARGQA
ncbi:hypothetical protein GCM10023165_40270 [Variovorax defluvii]|uniref:Uncharacterized protein n=1 Tax=Variovorax defluvii TaxID=913761 RepID=A0ABP8I5X6_9BURK